MSEYEVKKEHLIRELQGFWRRGYAEGLAVGGMPQNTSKEAQYSIDTSKMLQEQSYKAIEYRLEELLYLMELEAKQPTASDLTGNTKSDGPVKQFERWKENQL